VICVSNRAKQCVSGLLRGRNRRVVCEVGRTQPLTND
jgi:hypothetical protein